MEFTQKNGMIIKEGKLYLSVVKELIKIEKIDQEKNSLICYNISLSCRSWHRLDAAIKDNKFILEKY